MDRYSGGKQLWSKIAQTYQDRFMGLDLYNDTYDFFCEEVKAAGAEILEAGCGPGIITRYLLSKRPDFRIDAIDYAPNMVQLAQINCPDATCSVMDIRDIRSLNKTYDGIICGFCIPYLSKMDCNEFLKTAFAMLRPNGVIYCSFIEGDYNQSGFEFGSNMVDKVFVHYYSESLMREMFLNNGFVDINVFRKEMTRADNSLSSQLIFIARKRNL